MKKAALLVIFVLALLAGGFVASPYLALQGLGDALKAGDPVQLEARVDFPALRQNLKDQLNAAFAKKVGPEDSDNPLVAFAATLADAVVDRMVEARVTPAGMAQLVTDNQNEPEKKYPFANAETAFEGLSLFRVTLHRADGDKLNLFLRRDGLTWKLHRIDLPLAALDQD
ncbi:MAG: hypothetical protein K0Q68_1558 [Moraxellaceae bacterium]|jgi:hypothetical protein|nr:hypothetical protein [Moraxellaceae bacterium]